MNAYFAIKFREDNGNRELIENISAAMRMAGITSVVMARDYEKWGEVQIGSPHELMEKTFKEIDTADFLLVEFTEKGVGIGIEAGYAYAKRKPIVVIAKKDSHISSTLDGIARSVVFYEKPENLDFQEMKVQVSGSN